MSEGFGHTLEEGTLVPTILQIVDPEAAKVVRLTNFDDNRDRIRIKYRVVYEGDPANIEVLVPLDDFATFVVALLNAFGFPEGDLGYVADRLMHEIAAEAQPKPSTQEKP